MAHVVLVPFNLDVESILEDNPTISLPSRGKRNIEIPYYFCGILVTSKLKHGGYNEKNEGYTSLHSKYLKKIHVQYKLYLDFLTNAGILKQDGSFVQGYKSKGFKFQQDFIGVPLKEVELTDFLLRKGIKKQTAEKIADKRKALRKYNHIVKWFIDKGLEIDKGRALEWIEQQYKQELVELLFCTKNKKKLRAKKLYDVWQAARYFVDKLDRKAFDLDDFSTDTFGNRLHGMFTYQHSELRNFITYRGQQLVSIDIKNSQPYFSTLLLDKDFWKSRKTQTSKLKLSEINEELYRHTRQQARIQESIKWLDSSGSLTRRRVSAGCYKQDVISGQLYEKFLEKLRELLPAAYIERYGHRVSNRKGVKQEVLRTLYCMNNVMQDDFHLPSRVFEASYPEAMRFFKVLKERDHKLLARIIQQIESHCVLKLVCGRIAEERPDMPLFTIHDCIVTTVGNQDYVKQVIERVLTQKVGAAPTLKFEFWTIGNSSNENVIESNN